MSSQNEQSFRHYYGGHTGEFGHEFLEMDFSLVDDGRMAKACYAPPTPESAVHVSDLLVREIKRIITESEIMKEDDAICPRQGKNGKKTREIRTGDKEISVRRRKLVSVVEMEQSKRPGWPAHDEACFTENSAEDWR
ncbi:mago nashi protein [Sphaerosporella brunnea]|uniref:Mago nashi protein n=1 Tax=Sphaerosporella brunnea TaxID=1250544 RepID=A0A5J5F6J2_9PEZI|nr:mago nashi protein [Sphaerosporella brunnea]